MDTPNDAAANAPRLTRSAFDGLLQWILVVACFVAPVAVSAQSIGPLRVQPSHLVFNMAAGQACTNVQQLHVIYGAGQVAWTSAANQPWLKPDSDSGSTPESHGVWIDPTAAQTLAPGIFEGQVRVTVNGSSESQTVSVTLIVNPSGGPRPSTWKDGHRGAFSVSVDDSLPAGYETLLQTGIKGTYFLNGQQAADFFSGFYQNGMEIGSHLLNHHCHALDETTLRANIEPNIAGISYSSQMPINDFVGLAWPCGFYTIDEEVFASEYYLYARGYGINQLEDPTPSDFMNLKSFNSHEHNSLGDNPNLIEVVDAAEAEGKWASLVFHAELNDDGAVEYSLSKDLWLAPISSVVKYVHQRDRVVISNLSQSDSSISFSVRRLPLDLPRRLPGGDLSLTFETALNSEDVVTMELPLPDTAQGTLQIQVDGQDLPYSLRTSGNQRKLYFNLLPTQVNQSVVVLLSSEPTPVLAPLPANLVFVAYEGTDPAAQTFQIKNIGSGNLEWRASAVVGADWLSVTPDEGSGNQTLTVSVDTSTLFPGTHTGTLLIESPGTANSPQEIEINLTLLDAGTVHYDFTYPDRSSLLAPATGWTYRARTATGGVRETEATTDPLVVSYDQAAHPGTIRIPAASGQLWGVDNNSINSLFRDLPPTWTSIRMKASFHPAPTYSQNGDALAYHQIGLLLYRDDDNYVSILRILNPAQPPLASDIAYQTYYANNQIETITEAGAFPELIELAPFPAANFFLRLDRLDAITVAAYYSVDGETWLDLPTDVEHNLEGTGLVQPLQLCVYVGGGFPTLPAPPVDIHWVEVVNPPPLRTLTIGSQAPDSGAPILINRADHAGDSDGTTQFSRSYYQGTQLQLTAGDVPGRAFKQWRKDGQLLGTDPVLKLTVDADHTLTAVYGAITRTLKVKSVNPGSGVAVHVTPTDNTGQSDGTTEFVRTYDSGTDVTLTAPTLTGKVFQKWLNSAGLEIGSGTSVIIHLDSDQTVTAVYSTALQSLAVNSSNPDSGVQITVAPADKDGNAQGLTPARFSYEYGTEVQLTASTSVTGKSFQKWVNGAGQELGTSPNLKLTLTSDQTITAVYTTLVHTLTVNSSNPDSGAAMTVSPADNTGATTRSTPAAFTYNYGTDVTVTAPTIAGKVFQKWQDGSGQDLDAKPAITVKITSNLTLTAIYGTAPIVRTLTVKSSNPDSGVDIAASPADNAAKTHGVTQFSLAYNEGTKVTLTAPAQAGENRFVRWTNAAGTELGTDPVLALTLQTDLAITAVYGAPPAVHTLTVQSANPDSGVSVSLAPADKDGVNTGSTPAVFKYIHGSVVTLSAVSPGPGKTFQKWQNAAGDQLGTDPTVQLTVNSDLVVTAVFVNTLNKLKVASQNPDSGVDIGVSPADNANLSHAPTPATFLFKYGSAVTLTAPSLEPAKQFLKWVDGSGQTLGTDSSVQVTLRADLNVTAVYATAVRRLTVNSSNPDTGVDVNITPRDNNGASHALTQANFLFNYGTDVIVTAPAISGKTFQKWINGSGDSLGTAPALSLKMESDWTVTAVYVTAAPVQKLTVESSNPDSQVAITVSPADNNHADNGTTKFTRSFNRGTVVTLTAPATAGGNSFLKWQRDGADAGNNPTIQVTMDGDHSLKAVYVTPSLWTLTVNSSNPDRWVLINASPADNDGDRAGFTTFRRSYKNGTVVTLTAPANYLGRDFQKWQKDGVDLASTPTVQVNMDGHHTLTAVYTVTPIVRTLTVASVNPGSGVSVTVSPADNNSRRDGNTEFTRSYNHGTVVTLTAPPTANGNIFQKWQKDGVDFSKNASINVTIDASKKLTAIYVAPPVRTVTIASSNPSNGVGISVDVADKNGRRDGTTKFTRSYQHGTVITLTAPAIANANGFVKWQKDGADYSTSASVKVTVDGDTTLTAVYTKTPVLHTLTVASSNPNSGVAMSVSPSDYNGKRDGTTRFSRLFKTGTIVTLKAPGTVKGKYFQKWQKDGTDLTTSATAQITVDGDHTLTAVYVNRPVTRTLTVASANPNSGVTVTVSPADKNKKSEGTTKFTRSYDQGAAVTLKAPSKVNGNTFQKWQMDGADFSTSPTALVFMDSDHTVTAVYFAPVVVRTLAVTTVNPATGVTIAVSPADNSGASSSPAPFLRSYNDGKVVSLTAPANAGGNTFQKWQRNGADYSSNPNISVTMDANYTLTAVYATPVVVRTLTVNSSNPASGVNISVSPSDNGNSANGTAPFTRSYNQGKVVSLTAPESAGGNVFQKWQRNGLDYGTSPNTTVIMDANYTLTAVFVTPATTRKTLTVNSLNPASGVSVTVFPSDRNGAGSGSTSFTRLYDLGTYVLLLAPSKASGSGFERWLRDGAEYSRSTLILARMDADHTFTAAYKAPSSPGLPAAWGTQDVGSTGASGSVSYNGSTFTVKGSGADIWNNADEFRYVYQAASGDCSIIARVKSVQNTDPWAKAGVMIRESLNDGSKHASVFVTPSNGVAFQWRNTTSSTSQNVNTTGLSAPYWLKLVRSGNTITASRSSNGTSWTVMGSQTISMGSNVFIGLAVTSHKDGTQCSATVDNVTVNK